MQPKTPLKAAAVLLLVRPVSAADEHLFSIRASVVCGPAGAAQVSTDSVSSSGAAGLLFRDRKKK